MAKTSGKVERYRYANSKALMEVEEEEYGSCLLKEMRQSYSTKHREPFCMFTYEPAMYRDNRTGIPYADMSCYPLIDEMDKGDILTFENLQKVLELEHK